MSSLAYLATLLEQTLSRQPMVIDRECGFCRRRSKCTGRLFVTTLVLGWAQNPAASLQELANLAATLGTRLSPQALDQRLRSRGAVPLLQGVLATVLAVRLPALAVTLPLLERFPAVVAIDSTVVRLPDQLGMVWRGSGGFRARNTQAALKIGIGLDLGRGRLLVPSLTHGRTQDRSLPIQHAQLPPGAVRLADLGFWSLRVLKDIVRRGGHFISYLHVQTVLLDPASGQRIDLDAWLTSLDPAVAVHERTVLLGVTAKLPVRLIVQVRTAEETNRRQRQLLARARSKGVAVSSRTYARAGWDLIVTDLTTDRLTADEARALLRARWQIELLFKLWKSGLGLTRWRSADPDRIHAEVLAKLIACLLLHPLFALGWTRPDHAWHQILTTVRNHLAAIMHHLDHPRALIAELQRLREHLQQIGGVKRRSDRPATFQTFEPDVLFS